MTDFMLVVKPAHGAEPLRIPLSKRITSIGSDSAADVRIATAPSHWAIVHRGSDAVEVVISSSGERRGLAAGELLESDGISIMVESLASEREREHAIEDLVTALAAVELADRAVDLLVSGIIASSGADVGALILRDGDGYSVAAARDSDGRPLSNAHELLSDTIVSDVLHTGERVQLDDVDANSRYAAIPSVVAMQLRSAICLPMRLDGRTLGAVFVARHGRSAYDERTVAELRILSAIAVPFIAQLRRGRAAVNDEIVGDSPAVQRLRALVERVGPSDLSALLHGPSGSGKELVARALHSASGRASKPMIAINCASVAPTLLDAELFGYRKGAFTGAMSDRVGLVEAAHGSTLFLDEIGDMPLPMQAALLRVLEQREVKRLGENTARTVDFRLVCATHRDLEVEVAEGRFRADLLFRLREVTIEVPPLAARGDDIELLAYTFLRQTEHQLGLVQHAFTEDALQALRLHAWPGNVRELKATVRRVAVLADSKLIRGADLGFVPSTRIPPSQDPAEQTPMRKVLDDALSADRIRPLATVRDELVKQYVLLIVERCGGDREAAAKALEIGVRSLYRYIA